MKAARRAAGPGLVLATSEIRLRIEGQDLHADRGADAASSWAFGQRGGVRGPFQRGDLATLQGVWGDPYVTAEPDGRLTAFRGPTGATLFRLEKLGGPTELIREGDAVALVDAKSGRVVRADGGRVVAGPPGDAAAARFVSVLAPRLGSAAKY